MHTAEYHDVYMGWQKATLIKKRNGRFVWRVVEGAQCGFAATGFPTIDRAIKAAASAKNFRNVK